jgi:hypothetical protein
VCVRIIPGVYHADLWRFSTSTRGWERVDNTAANGAVPSGRASHVMTSVGLDLWLHGGTGDTYSGEGDTCSGRTALCSASGSSASESSASASGDGSSSASGSSASVRGIASASGEGSSSASESSASESSASASGDGSSCCRCAERESVTLCTFSDFVSCGVCTDHDLCVYVS